MSGNIRGKVDCFSNTGNTSFQTNEFFKGMYDFFASHPNVTLISRNSGGGSAAGDINYWDQANRFRNNAWAVFRFNATVARTFPVYVQIQYGESGSPFNFGNSPGSPGLVDGTNASGNTAPMVGFQCAIGEGGDQNPFKGTMNAGSPNDTRSDPIWGTPVGGTRSHIFPRTNNPGGPAASVTSKHDFAQIAEGDASAPMRYHFIADDDSFVILVDQGDDNSYAFNYCGLFVPRAGFTPTYPFIMAGASGPNILPVSLAVYGSPSLTGLGRRNGGVVAGLTANGVRNIFFDRFQTILSSAQQPNQQLSTPEYEEFPMPVYTNETTAGVVSIGHLGQTSFLKECVNISTNDTNVALTRAAFGDTTLTTTKLMVPWGGASPPKTTSTRGGTIWSRARVATDD